MNKIEKEVNNELTLQKELYLNKFKIKIEEILKKNNINVINEFNNEFDKLNTTNKILVSKKLKDIDLEKINTLEKGIRKDFINTVKMEKIQTKNQIDISI